MDFLQVRQVATADDARSLNRYAAFADTILQFFRPDLLRAVRALSKGDGDIERAADRLAAWDGLREDADGEGKYDSPGVTIFQAWLRQILAETCSAAKAGPASSMLLYAPGDTPLGAKGHGLADP